MHLKTWTFAASLLWAGFGHAMPITDYNLILFGDYNFQGGDVHGRAFVGGDLNAHGQAAEFGSRVPKDPVVDTAVIAGDLNATNIQVQSGMLRYGGSNNVSGNINCNGGISPCAQATGGLDQVTENLRNQMQQASSDYAGLAANGNFIATQGANQPNTFQYGGTDPLAVFNLAGSDVFAQNNSLKLDHGDASTVIINVAGSEINVGGGVNLTNGFGFYADGDNIGARNILWNFFEAVSIDFGNTGMVGSVLAPWANVSGGNNFDGTLVAQSYTGGREFHDFSFIPPTTSVNEPPLWLLALLGLALIGTARRFAPAPTRQGDEA